MSETFAAQLLRLGIEEVQRNQLVLFLKRQCRPSKDVVRALTVHESNRSLSLFLRVELQIVEPNQ